MTCIRLTLAVICLSLASAQGARSDDFFPTNADEIIAAINNEAVNGDRVLLPAGTFDCSSTPLVTNQAISIVGKGRELTTLITNLAIEPADMRTPIKISGIKFDVRQSHRTNLLFGNSALYFSGGNFTLTYIEVQGPCLDDISLVIFSQHNHRRTIATVEHSVFRDGTADLLGTHNGNPDFGSQLTLYGCRFFDAGSGGSDQYWSAHGGFPIVAHRCVGYGNTGGSAIAPGTNGFGSPTRMELYDCSIEGEVKADVVVGCVIRTPEFESVAVKTANDGAVIMNNIITADDNFTKWGVRTDGRSCLIAGNDIRLKAVGSLAYGIEVSGEGDVLICDNYVEAGQGVQIDEESTGITEIYYNDLSQATQYSIRNESESATVLSDWNILGAIFGVELGPNDVQQ